MPLSEIILVVMGLLTVAMAAAVICRNIPIPYTVFLVVLGVFGGWLARSYSQFELLLQFQLTPELVLFLFLPALIFESSFNLDARQLIKDLAPIMALAIPAVLVSTIMIAAGLWLTLDMQIMLALLFGALISATDPVAVIALFKELGAPHRLTVLVEGESLLNDATAIVLFNIILGLTISGSIEAGGAGGVVVEFMRVFLGGIVVGAAMGVIVSECLYRLAAGVNFYMVMSVVLAYSSFAVAEHILHVSGVMAVVSGAIALGIFGVSRIPQGATTMVKETWEVIALVCNSLLFLLVGLSVDIMLLLDRAEVIIVAIFLVLLSRAATVYSMVPAAIRLFRLPRVSLGERHIMWWGGLKGSLAMAMVLLLPEDLPAKPLLLDMTLGVVLFLLLVNATTLRPLIHALGIDRLTEDEQEELKNGVFQAQRHADGMLQRFHDAELMSHGTRRLIRDKLQKVLALYDLESEHRRDLRYLFISALRVEQEELKHLHDIGLLQHYTYFDINNSLQRDREFWSSHPETLQYRQQDAGTGLFSRIENGVLKRLREHDWAAGILSRYQYWRLSHSMQRDIAGILMCSRVLENLRDNSKYASEFRREVEAIYRRRMDRCKQYLHRIATEFPDFYLRFQTRLFTRIAFISSLQHVEESHQSGEMGSKAYTDVERRVRNALSALASISDPIPELESTDLIATVPLLKGLSRTVLMRIAKVARTVTFLSGDVIIGENEKGDALYIISRGLVYVYKGEGDDPGDHIAELHDGDFFGEVALLGGQIRTATVKAKNPSTLIRISRRDILSLAQQEPELKVRLEEMRRLRSSEIDSPS